MSNPLSGPLSDQILQIAADVADDPTRFAAYADNPVGFAGDVLGIPLLEVRSGTPEDPDIVGLWLKQVECMEAVRDHHSVAIRSAHGIGKTYLMAVLALWWLYAKQGQVITTASSWDQVEGALWQAIHRLRAAAPVKLPGEENLTQIRVGHEWGAQGKSVAKATSFQGIHHKHLLVLIDEAPGIEPGIHKAISSLTTGMKNRRVMVGNPTETGGPFHRAFEGKTWTKVHISGLDHPNILYGREIIPGAITQGWIDQVIEEEGVDSDYYQSRVLGEFPTGSDSKVFPSSLVDRAMDEEKYAAAMADPQQVTFPVVLSLDIARFGRNRTVIVQRRGGVVEDIVSWQGQDTEKTYGQVVARWQATGAVAVVVDEVGLGGPLVDRMAAHGVPVHGFHAGKTARSDHYKNRRAELWMRVRREFFDKDRIRLPRLRQLREDLLAPSYAYDNGDKIVVEGKKSLEKQGVQSPDFADAVLMAFAADWELEAVDRVTAPPPWAEGVDGGWRKADEGSGLAEGLPSGF